MRVTIELFATFQTGRFDTEVRDYPPDTTVARVVENLGIPETELGLILINNGHALIEQQLVDGDTLTLLPLLGGG